MSPEATTEAVVPKHKPAKPNPKTDPDVLRSVLDDVSKERRAAHLSVRKRNQELQNESTELFARKTTTASALSAHGRYKAHMTPQAWAQEQSRLTKAAREADAAHKAFTEKLNTGAFARELAPLQDKVSELDKEWKIHARYAEKSGVDLKAFWTPEKGFADDELPPTWKESDLTDDEVAPQPEEAPAVEVAADA